MLLSIIHVRIVCVGWGVEVERNEQTKVKKFFGKMGFKHNAYALMKGFLAASKPNFQQWF